MKDIALYHQFFNPEDSKKPYDNLSNYIEDMFCMLDGYLYAAHILNQSETVETDSLVEDMKRVEAQIESRRNISQNHLISIEKTLSLTRFDRFLLIMALSNSHLTSYGMYYESLYHYYDMGKPSKGFAVYLYQIFNELSAVQMQQLKYGHDAVSRYFLKSGLNPKEGLLLEEELMQCILEEGKGKQVSNEYFYLIRPEENIAQTLHKEILNKLVRIWLSSGEAHGIVWISGAKGSGKKHIVRSFSAQTGKNIIYCNVDSFMQLSPPETEDKLNKLYLYALSLEGEICFKLSENSDSEEQVMVLQKILDGLDGINGIKKRFRFYLILTQSKEDSLLADRHNMIHFEIPPLSIYERKQLWTEFSKDISYEKNIDLEKVAAQYTARPGDIKKIIAAARLYAIGEGKEAIGEDELSKASMIAFAIKQGQNKQLGNMVERITTVYRWEDFVVSETLREQLIQICNQVKFRGIVEEEWGFGKKLAYGRGISVLFYGSPGTGKTMAAQVVANELGMELYRIDISGLSSKYIGETEKNISDLFKLAEYRNAILFFDEADAIFAKRSTVKSSNDRSANSVTAHLLQKLENYEGISILATNLLESVDDAFKRRIRFILQFEYPTAPMRLRLYQKILPESARCDTELDFEYYAEAFELSGSNIKEIMVNAAFMAAGNQEGISNKYMIQAIKQNYLKYGKILTDEDFAYLIEAQ